MNQMKKELGELLGKNPEEMAKVRALWKDCFHDSQSYMDFYFQWKTKDNVIFGIHEEEQLVSMVQLNPYEVSILDKEYSSYYIVGVATDAAYRKRGLMRRLLTQAMNYMYEEQVPFAYLMPAKEEIYLPFDFRIVTIQDRLSIPVKQIVRNMREPIVKAASIQTQDKDSSVLGIKAVLVDDTDTTMFANLAQYANEVLARDNHVYTVRDRYYYERMLAELLVLNGGILALLDQNKVVGYGAFALEEGKLEILELLVGDEVKGELLTQLNYEVLRRLEESWLEEEKDIEPSKAPPIMARIIHVPTFLRQLRATKEVELIIEVQDEYIKENEGIYKISCHREGCLVTKYTREQWKDSNIDMVCNIAQLTSLFFGQMTERDLTQFFTSKSVEIQNKLSAIVYLNRIHINEIV